MRTVFVLIVFLFMLSGCSLFRKVEKTVTTTKQITEREVDTTLKIIPNENIFRLDNIESRVGTDTLVFKTMSGTGKFFKTETSAGTYQTDFVFEPKAFNVPIKIHERVTTETKQKEVIKKPDIVNNVIGIVLIFFFVFLTFYFKKKT